MLKNPACCIFIAFLILNLSCYKHQDHGILAPETPNYVVSGVITDIDSNEKLANIEIHLNGAPLFHDTNFTGAIDTTDSLGNYSFAGIVPGEYLLVAKRMNFEVAEKYFLIFIYEDRTVDLAIPKPLVTRKEYSCSRRDFPDFEGFCWKYADTFAGVSLCSCGHRVLEGNFSEGFAVIGDKRFQKENPPFRGLAFLDRYWTCDSTKILSVSSSTGQVESTIVVGYELYDLTADASHLWALARIPNSRQYKILKYGNNPSMLEKVYELPYSQRGGIAWDGQNIWTSDSGDNLIYQYNREMQVIKTYKPFFVNLYNVPFFIRNIVYLACDSNGKLWAGDGELLYEFDIP